MLDHPLIESFQCFFQQLYKRQSAGIRYALAGIHPKQTQQMLIENIGNSNTEIEILYAVCGGSEDMPEEPLENVWWFSMYTFISLESGLHIRTQYLNDGLITNPALLPIFASGAGEILLYDINQGQSPIYYYFPGDSAFITPTLMYQNLQTMLHTIVEYLKQTENTPYHDILEWNYDLEYKISAQMNPDSPLWLENEE